MFSSLFVSNIFQINELIEWNVMHCDSFSIVVVLVCVCVDCIYVPQPFEWQLKYAELM